MPVSVSYPGVYLEEIPSGVRAITGVATAIAAFVGRTRRGPTDEAKRIYSWAEYEREYGGLWKDSTVSYAVNHYFSNGGTDAVIARAHRLTDTEGAADQDNATLTLGATDTFQLLSVTGKAYGLSFVPVADSETDFTLTITDPDDSSTQVLTLSIDPDSEDYIVTVLGSEDGTDTTRISLVSDDDVPLYQPTAASNTTMSAGAGEVLEETATATFVGTGDPLVLEANTPGAAANAMAIAFALDGTGGFTLEVTLGDVTESWTVVDYLAEADAFAANVASNSELFHVTQNATVLDIAAPVSELFEGGVDGADAAAAVTTISVASSASESFTFTASSPGEWGNNLRVSVDYNTRDTDDDTLFNVVVVEVDPDEGTEVRRETFRNLSSDSGSSRYAPTVLDQESDLVDLDDITERPPVVFSAALADGTDGQDFDDAAADSDLVEALGLLEEVDLFTLLCVPPRTLSGDASSDIGSTVLTEGIRLCDLRNAFFVVDSPANWDDGSDPLDGTIGVDGMNFREKNAAIYFPRLKMPDPLKENRLSEFAPCGVVAGIMARTDAQRGVWKAPAGIEANVRGVKALTVKLTDAQQGALNQVGVNCIRSFPVVGTVIWGARTMRGADVLADDWKYVPVRRLANYLRESLYRGSKWAVFEPNDEPLWAQLRLSIGSFMQTLFRQGAFQGKTPREAYFVKCDKETTTQTDINLGIVNILVGFAPLKPAEFVIIKLQQMAGQSG